MNNWNESDWFKLWLALARKSPDAAANENAFAEASVCRQDIAPATNTIPTVSSPELEVTE